MGGPRCGRAYAWSYAPARGLDRIAILNTPSVQSVMTPPSIREGGSAPDNPTEKEQDHEQHEPQTHPHRLYRARDQDRHYWTRIGAVFAHGKGGGFTVQVAAFPLDGKIVCLSPKEKPEGEEDPKGG